MEKFVTEIFDVDHTITEKSTALSYLFILIKRKYVSPSVLKSLPYVYLNYKYGRMDEKHFDRTVPELKGIKRSILETIALENFEKYIKKSIYPKTEDFIKKLKDNGKKIIFASSSLDIILQPLLKYLGADDLIATQFRFEDDLCTGEFLNTPVFKTVKRKKVMEYAEQHNILLEHSSFYSDSIHDRPLLEAVGNPVAVNPDIRLRLHAKKRGWQILDFRKK
ncbi:MAG: HAD-IB family hydrolase [Spirochaetaceae bacterium]|nr:HAD-IB family hydrolase [Spirochaetaceae bacterium]